MTSLIWEILKGKLFLNPNFFNEMLKLATHYNDVIMSATASQITSLTIVYSTVYSRRRSKKTSKLRVTGFFVMGIHRWPVNSPHKGQVMRKMFPFDDVFMNWVIYECQPTSFLGTMDIMHISQLCLNEMPECYKYSEKIGIPKVLIIPMSVHL